MADGMDAGGDKTLRAKYLDWCSARIAERFLDLGPEEIYELAHPVAGAAVQGGGRAEFAGLAASPPELPTPEDESYRSLVQRVTESLLGQMALPTFEQWSEAYAESPARFDAEMLGFWREVTGEDAADPADPTAGESSAGPEGRQD